MSNHYLRRPNKDRKPNNGRMDEVGLNFLRPFLIIYSRKMSVCRISLTRKIFNLCPHERILDFEKTCT